MVAYLVCPIGNVTCVLCRTVCSSDAIVACVGCMADWICDSGEDL